MMWNRDERAYRTFIRCRSSFHIADHASEHLVIVAIDDESEHAVDEHQEPEKPIE